MYLTQYDFPKLSTEEPLQSTEEPLSTEEHTGAPVKMSTDSR